MLPLTRFSALIFSTWSSAHVLISTPTTATFRRFFPKFVTNGAHSSCLRLNTGPRSSCDAMALKAITGGLRKVLLERSQDQPITFYLYVTAPFCRDEVKNILYRHAGRVHNSSLIAMLMCHQRLYGEGFSCSEIDGLGTSQLLPEGWHAHHYVRDTSFFATVPLPTPARRWHRVYSL